MKPRHESRSSKIASFMAARPQSMTLPTKKENAQRLEDDSDTMSVTAASEISTVVVANPLASRALPPNVLVQNDYVDAVSTVIERDFFPDLPGLRMKSALLEALDMGDLDRAASLREELFALRNATPFTTPGQLTPISVDNAGGLPNTCANNVETFSSAELDVCGTGASKAFEPDAVARLKEWEGEKTTNQLANRGGTQAQIVKLTNTQGKDVLVDLSTVRLDDFQRVFTSEDTASFEKHAAKDLELKRAKWWWIEASEKKNNTIHKHLNKVLLDGGSIEPGTMVPTIHKGRHALSFHQETVPQRGLQKPKIQTKNTRFTSKQQQELDAMLEASFAARVARVGGERLENAFKVMKDDVRCKDLKTFMRAMKVRETRTRGQQFDLPIVRTPELAPGMNGLSPFVTYGKIGSTPKRIEDDIHSKFNLQQDSARECVADRLQRAAMNRHSDASRTSKVERLKALGVFTPGVGSSTPLGSRTPGSNTPGNMTPSGANISPYSPVGQLIHRARKMAQQGGQLRILAKDGNRCRSNASTEPGDVQHPRKRSRAGSVDAI